MAREAAVSLQAPLDVLIVRKLGVPGPEELAFGALASGGAVVLNRDLIKQLRLSEAQLARVQREADEVVCLSTPDSFGSVGQWYQHFGQISHAEVHEVLAAGELA